MYSLPSACSNGANSESNVPITHFQSPSLETLVVQDTLGHTPQPHGHNYSATAYNTSQLSRPQVSEWNAQPAGGHTPNQQDDCNQPNNSIAIEIRVQQSRLT